MKVAWSRLVQQYARHVWDRFKPAPPGLHEAIEAHLKLTGIAREGLLDLFEGSEGFHTLTTEHAWPASSHLVYDHQHAVVRLLKRWKQL